MNWVNAGEYAKEKDRAGERIETLPMGRWGGGLCEVIEMFPDKEENIVLQVRRLEDGEECGVFGEERVGLPIE